MTIELPKRTRLSLVGVSVLFFFIFSGLFCGFLIAHFFPEQVMRLIYGVSSEPPSVLKEVARSDTVSALLANDAAEDDGARERDLSASFQLQGALDPAPLTSAAAKADPPSENFPRFVKRYKPPPPGMDIPVASSPAAPLAQTAQAAQAVSSYLPVAQYPAAEWRRIETHAGFIDSMTIVSTGAKVSDSAPKANDMIDISGWIGDPTLGLRFKDVVFSVCGKIVGHTKVGLSRPDVAKAVHPNLAPSGWRARLYVGYLPRCPGASLLVLGVVPGSVTVVTVDDPVPLKLPPAEKPPANAPKGAPLFTPKSVSPARFVSLELLSDVADLRRCAGADCAVVGQLAKGRYQGHLAEEADGWVLLILSDKAGWLPRSQLSWAR